MKPKRIEFDLGCNASGHRFRLVWNGAYGDWEFHCDLNDERKSNVYFSGLMRSQLLLIGEAARGVS